jgi:hypothetical protein
MATAESSKHTQNINDSYSSLKEGIEQVVESTARRKEPERRQPWFDEECKKAIQDKNTIHWLMQQKRRTRVEEEYKRLRREEKHIHQKKKREHYVEKLTEVEALGENSKSRMFCKKNTRNNFQAKEHYVQVQEWKFSNRERKNIKKVDRTFQSPLKRRRGWRRVPDIKVTKYGGRADRRTPNGGAAEGNKKDEK